MRMVVPDFLWLGNAGDTRKIADLADLGIEAVVDLAANEKPLSLPRDWIYCRIPLIDGEGNTPYSLRLAVGTVQSLVAARIKTLLFCSAGMSRSVAVAAAALAKVQHQAPDRCLAQVVAEGPADVAPGLWSEVHFACFGTAEAGSHHRPAQQPAAEDAGDEI